MAQVDSPTDRDRSKLAKRSLFLLALLALAGLDPSRAVADAYIPLDYFRPHLDIRFAEPVVPNLTFHRDPELKRPPVLVLDGSGLYKWGKLVCSWPGGRFDVEKSYMMLLEPLSRKAPGRFELCVEGSPVISTPGDNGLGIAALYVEFVRRDATAFVANCDGLPCYLGVDSLPPGWVEVPSEDDAVRSRRAEIDAAREQDPALDRFLDGAAACISRQDAPACLAPLVSERAVFPDGRAYGWKPAPPESPPHPGPARARAVIDYLWSTEGRQWVKGCIRNAPAGDLDPDRLTVGMIDGTWVACSIVKEDGEWRLYEVLATE